MSHAQTKTSSTPTAPALKPSGFPLGWRRYRSYTLFAFTCIPMAISGVLLLQGVSALGQGEQAWAAWLAGLASPGIGWVGRKIAAGRIGPIPAPGLPMPILGVAPIGGFVTLWLVLLLILGGAIG